ncbi:sugar phosphate isomerase/epimerase family protein [Marinococcus luteus]|uniref:sugar phosphate isomerase/epimerase family protein n=1 Tax=Marinococcus luteus TaxID=1122204 RepID=UPI002ACCF298|nr:sugar phosphate isomerase/epimerase [Marinococcus luteus]MDZ5783930.1 sugar phosphate isomerase/epimerase [Marinococcus luteus]
MEPKFSLAHLTALEYSPPELTYLAAKAGFDYVSMRPIYMGLPDEKNYDLANNREMYKKTKKALQETGLELLDIELAKVDKGIDYKNYEPAFEVAAELGGKHVLSSIWVDDEDFALEQFSKICDLANQYNLTVDLEYVPIASITNLSETVEILKKADKKNTGLMIDAHHFYRAGDKAEELSELPGEWFHYMHLCDAPGVEPSSQEEMTRILREERPYVGEGAADISGLLRNTPNVPYSLEIPHIRRAKELGYEKHAKKCLQTAKQYVKNTVFSGES